MEDAASPRLRRTNTSHTADFILTFDITDLNISLDDISKLIIFRRKTPLKSPQQMLPLTEAFYYILIALYKEPAHGYGIMQDTEKMSGGRVKIGAGTLYTALNTLLKKGLIDHYPMPEGSDPRRKMYQITPDGKTVVAAEIVRLKELLAAGEQAVNETKE